MRGAGTRRLRSRSLSTASASAPGKIHHALADACEKAGVPYITHHSLRHSFARTLRRSGYTMQQIGKLLGHESGSSMTVMYADMADDEVIETARRVTFEQIEKVIKK